MKFSYIKDSNGNIINKGRSYYSVTKANGSRKAFIWRIDAEQYAFALRMENECCMVAKATL